MKTMMKIVSVLAALTMLTACAFAETTDTPADTGDAEVGMANPWVEYDSLEALNEAAGTNLQLPGVMGVDAVSYRMLSDSEGTIAELDFQVNGMDYTLRASDTAEDISGVYLEDGKTAFEGHENGPLDYVTTDTMKLARWNDVNCQYVLMVTDNGTLDQETFESIVEEMEDMTRPAAAVTLEDGTYYDEVSQRAYAIVAGQGDDTYAIEIHWANSATEDNVWTMTARVTEDGLLSYSDCVENLVVTDENGNTTETPADLIPEGYFVPSEDGTSFDWSGSPEENCQSCVFALPQE